MESLSVSETLWMPVTSRPKSANQSSPRRLHDFFFLSSTIILFIFPFFFSIARSEIFQVSWLLWSFSIVIFKVPFHFFICQARQGSCKSFHSFITFFLPHFLFNSYSFLAMLSWIFWNFFSLTFSCLLFNMIKFPLITAL